MTHSWKKIYPFRTLLIHVCFSWSPSWFIQLENRSSFFSRDCQLSPENNILKQYWDWLQGSENFGQKKNIWTSVGNAVGPDPCWFVILIKKTPNHGLQTLHIHIGIGCDGFCQTEYLSHRSLKNRKFEMRPWLALFYPPPPVSSVGRAIFVAASNVKGTHCKYQMGLSGVCRKQFLRWVLLRK